MMLTCKVQRNTHFVVHASGRQYVYITSDELKAIDWVSTLRANARGRLCNFL